tara:strand:+ start:243 stop:491 length:249 start_codon:yes stop_codon:yes gene_type:complete
VRFRVSVEEFAQRINDAKRLLPWHREYLEELLKYYVLLTPEQRKSIFISRGYGDPLYIRFVRTRDRDNLITLCREAIGAKDV